MLGVRNRFYTVVARKSLRLSSSAAKTADPLRILFCGSDAFSIFSLDALHKEHSKDNGLIASIDVVCRPSKRVGRGLKAFRTGKMKSFFVTKTIIEFGL